MPSPMLAICTPYPFHVLSSLGGSVPFLLKGHMAAAEICLTNSAMSDSMVQALSSFKLFIMKSKLHKVEA